QDRVVDEAERELHGEPRIGFLGARQCAAGASVEATEQRVREFMAQLAHRRPERRLADAANQARAPEAAAAPVVANGLVEQLVQQPRVVRLFELALPHLAA